MPLLSVSLAMVVLSGCADGPLRQLASLNPRVRAQWAAEEQQYGPTFHRKVAELKALREQVPQLNPQQQQQASQELLEVLEEETNPLVRVELVRTLGAFSTALASGGLRLALADSDSRVRITACQVLGRRGGAEALELLAATVGSDTDTDVRLAATRELARFQNPLAVRALAIPLDDPDPALQFRAVQSLKTASGRDYGHDLTAWRQFVQGNDPGPPAPVSLVERLRNLF